MTNNRPPLYPPIKTDAEYAHALAGAKAGLALGQALSELMDAARNMVEADPALEPALIEFCSTVISLSDNILFQTYDARRAAIAAYDERKDAGLEGAAENVVLFKARRAR